MIRKTTDNGVSSSGSVPAEIGEIREKIIHLVDIVICCLDPFLANKQCHFFPDTLADFETVCEGNILLKKKLNEYLKDEAIEQHISSNTLPHYLTKVRHDLRNCVNIINGYLEIILEDCAKKQLTSAIDQLSEMLTIVGQILPLIETIKSPESHISSRQLQPIDSGGKLPVGGNIESPEYRDFKEKFSILIVDDNEGNCQILKRHLSSIGYKNFQVAYSGSQTLSLIKKHKIDLVLLDIDMPGMSGIDVLQSLKENIIKQRLMVLMISAADTLQNTIECIKLGAEDFLPKPINIDLLRARVGSCIEKKWFINNENKYRERIEIEKQRYEGLLRAVFPSIIVEELTQNSTVKPAYYTEVAIMFADLVGFTAYCDTHEPEEVLQTLQDFAEMCESVAINHHLQKIKTIGDCFLGTVGMLSHRENPVQDCIECAKSLIANSSKLPSKWQLHIGIHFGTVIGGIVGHRQYQFDIWGDAVNTAARLQAIAKPNAIYLSKQAWERVLDLYNCRSLGMHAIRGKAPLEIFEYVSDFEYLKQEKNNGS